MEIPDNKLFVPFKGTPCVISDNNFESMISKKMSRVYVCGYLDNFGYSLIMCHDKSSDNLPINNLCSLIAKENGPIKGNCIIMDSNKDLSLQDLSELIKIAQIVPSYYWIPECLVERFMHRKLYYGATHNDNELGQCFAKYIAENPKEDRLTVWNKAKEFYISDSDEDSIEYFDEDESSIEHVDFDHNKGFVMPPVGLKNFGPKKEKSELQRDISEKSTVVDTNKLIANKSDVVHTNKRTSNKSKVVNINKRTSNVVHTNKLTGHKSRDMIVIYSKYESLMSNPMSSGIGLYVPQWFCYDLVSPTNGIYIPVDKPTICTYEQMSEFGYKRAKARGVNPRPNRTIYYLADELLKINGMSPFI